MDRSQPSRAETPAEAPTVRIRPAGAAPRRARGRGPGTAGKVALSALSVMVLATTGVAWSVAGGLLGGLSTSDALDAGAPKSAGGDTNVLLIGLDSRKDQDGNQLPKEILDQLHAGDGTQGGYNTNTLILMHIPAGGGKVKAVSIPRDDYVPVKGIPGYRNAKIKEAYGLAKYYAEQDLVKQGVTGKAELEHRGREAGRKKTLETVREFLDVPIDRFAEVNLAGFFDLANALDGVEVCLKRPVRDSFSGANFPAGRQTLNGAQSLAFVRQRHGLDNDDLDRTHRQQAFLASVAHKLRSAGTFTDLGKLRKLVDAARKDVVVSGGWDLVSFAQQAQGLTGGNLEFSTLPIAGYQTVDGQDVNKVDTGQVRAAVRTAFGMDPPVPATPEIRASSTVDVRNANGAAGLAATVAKALEPYGFRTGTLDTATAADSSVTYGEGARADAAAAARLVKEPLGRLDPGLPAGHVRIVLGPKFTLPPELGPHGADAAPGPSTGAAPSGAPSGAAAPPADGLQGGVVDGGGIPCVD
ncbi:LCP family protein [Amycolatopsis samaneae]|uniref:LCP family protein n=1 Tax=Amycolatopsis samaneae TaxID=664691 RepID=A0ABW5GW25_9PSEU